MLKSIPKSSVTKRKFQVYKLWNVNQDTYVTELISGSNPLYQSIRSKYYSNLDGNIVNTFGSYENLARLSFERTLSNEIYVIDIDRDKFGELIKKKSVTLTDSIGEEYIDDGYGRIINPIPTYRFTRFDAELGVLTIQQATLEYDIDVITFDIESGGIVVLDDGDAETYYVISIDFETGLIKFTYELDFQNIDFDVLSFGNVFYSDGILVIKSELDVSSYDLEYRSTQTIYETEILVSVKAGEFNYSQNPSAVNVRLSGSYDFETTPIFNTSPAKNVKIKEVLDIEQKKWYSGSLNPSISGSWDDYYNSSSVDPTGSYLAPFITTIGLYDDDGDMVAIAKLPQPIKNLPDYDLNFLIRFDT